MNTTQLPVLGAALSINSAEPLLPWIREKNRDLEIQDFVFPGVLDAHWREIAQRYDRLLDGHRGRVGLHGPFFGLDLAAFDPQIQAVIQSRLLQGLEICEQLTATQMVVHSPFTAWHHQNFGHSSGLKDRIYEACHENLAPVIARAQDIGCTLVLENIEDVDPAERRRLTQYLNSDSVKISVDTGHAHLAHDCAGAPPVDYFIKDAGAELAHVHIQDTDGYADRHWLPGKGRINWPAFFEALGRNAANPHLVIEVQAQYQATIPECVAQLEAMGLAQ
ncbi:MAG: sugar phosphate isomerase/epimerase family protein [Pseudomonadota bacterium]